jgi:fatty acid desaturase
MAELSEGKVKASLMSNLFFVGQSTQRTLHPVLDPAFRHRFADAFQPQPWIYWSDFLISTSLGWAAFVLSVQTSPLSLPHIGGTMIAIVALLRAVIFIHELAHLKRGTLPGFELAWNLCVGLPFLLPSLMYVGCHNDHHRQATFGTINDPEYLPLAQRYGLEVARFISIAPIVPVLLALRWGVCGPLSFLIPSLRRFIIERGSSLIINTNYRRLHPHERHAKRWLRQEVAAAIVFWAIVGGVLTGAIALQWIWQWYLVATGVVLVNQVRTLAAHRYNNTAGTPLDSTGQLLDSITLNGGLLTILAAPVGLRYHALHHALPTVPYHSLGPLHRRLLAELPVDAPYRRTQQRGILSTIRTFFHQQPEEATEPLPSRITQ